MHVAWQMQYWRNQAGFFLRWGLLSPEKSGITKGILLLLPGNGAALEHYQATAVDFASKGYAVYGLEWLGQGGSDRMLPNRHKLHSRGFHLDILDLRQWVEQIILPAAADLPIYMMGMSRAGSSLRYLHDYGDVIRRAVLVTPMLGIHTGPYRRAWVRMIAKTMVWLGFGRRYALGQKDWKDRLPRFEGNTATHDRERFWARHLVFHRDPRLQTGGVTWRWLHEAFQTMGRLRRPLYLKQITTPLLVVTADDERVVDNAATLRAVHYLPNAKHVHLKDSRHDPWNETDAVRKALLDAVLQFLEA